MTTYGQRLAQAMQARGDARGQKVTRLEVAGVAGCSRENIGMILTNSKGRDQKLSTTSHQAVDSYLRCDSNWLLKGEGVMTPKSAAPGNAQYSDQAMMLAQAFDAKLEGVSDMQRAIIQAHCLLLISRNSIVLRALGLEADLSPTAPPAQSPQNTLGKVQSAPH